MSKHYREWSPRQSFLLPPSPLEWLPEDDLAFFLLDVVETLDLGSIEAPIRAKDPRGTRPYHPRMMTALLLYGYSVGVYSSRKLERACYRDVAFRVITGGQQPDHSVISDFRRQHLEALKGLFLQTVRLCQKAGLVSLGRVALDGTKVQGNASKHKAMSYQRMLKSEVDLQAEIEELLAQAERTDQAENAEFGKDRRGDELPEELRRREQRLERIREARKALEEEAATARSQELRERAIQQQERSKTASDPVERKRAASRAAKNERESKRLAQEARTARKDTDDDDFPQHRVPTTTEGKPTPKAQRNFTDPDSRIMKRDGTYLQGYNAQAVVDRKHQVIVGCGVGNQPPDQEYLPPMVEQVRRNTGKYPEVLLADAGYWDEHHVTYLEERGIDPYIATKRLKHGEQSPPDQERPPGDLTPMDRMWRKLRTTKGRETYAQRKSTVEPVFGQIRESQGLRRFLLRGMEKVQGEWSLFCAAHNLRKLHRAVVIAVI